MKRNKFKKEIDIADKLSDALSEAIDDKKQFYRYIIKEKNGSDSGEEERIFDKMDMQSLNSAIKALSALQEIKCTMYGLTSPQDERTGKPTDKNQTEEQETGVVILPQVSEE